MRRHAQVRIKTLQINGQDIGAREDETILELAKENGIHIPTMCHLEGLSDMGGCRLCLVEIKGNNKLLPACMVYAEEGMEVFTDSERLLDYRRMIISMLFAEGNHVCAVCVSNGHCDLQNTAVELGITHINVPYLNPVLPVDASHDLFVMDHNRCIKCTRCVRVCDEIEGAHTWDVMGRGFESQIVADLNQPWGEAVSCTSCGKCVQVCPTGALFQKGLSAGEMTKKREFLPYLQTMRKK